MLNKVKGNMYEFATHTWNTIKGKCPHDCSYCYMKRFKQGEIHFDQKELTTDLGSGNFIFVGSSCDLFAEGVPDDWIIWTLDHCIGFDNTYLFQTKNPARFEDFSGRYPTNSIFCTTIETNRENDLSNCPERKMRMVWMCGSFLSDKRRMITIEPIMEFDMDELVRWIEAIRPECVNIGADSGNNSLPEPEADKIRELILRLSDYTRVNLKFNLHRILKKKPKEVIFLDKCLWCGSTIKPPKERFCCYKHAQLYHSRLNNEKAKKKRREKRKKKSNKSPVSKDNK